MRRTVPNAAHRVVPIRAAVRTGGAQPRAGVEDSSGAQHPRRRADDVPRDTDLVTLTKTERSRTAEVNIRRLTDWPADRAREGSVQQSSPVPLWHSRPVLLATLWGSAGLLVRKRQTDKLPRV